MLKYSDTAFSVAAALFCLTACFGIGGCGAGNPLDRQAVSGTVTLDGSPLQDGCIEFLPQDTEGRAGGSAIRNGAYAIPVAKGLVPGRYVVRISSAARSRNVDFDAPPGPTLPETAKERIPSRYNSETTLTAEIKSGKANAFDFAIESK